MGASKEIPIVVDPPGATGDTAAVEIIKSPLPPIVAPKIINGVTPVF